MYVFYFFAIKDHLLLLLLLLLSYDRLRIGLQVSIFVGLSYSYIDLLR